MPSQFDNSYHAYYRKPTFDDETSQELYQINKEANEVLELRTPDVPTPEQEVEYIDWLQDDFKSDPWLTYRFRKYTANPKRIPWKNNRKLKRQYTFSFMCNWALFSAISWPIACAIGRRWKVTRGGVPRVPLNRQIHDFPNVDPGTVARKNFRWYAFGSALLMGYCSARYVTDPTMRSSNTWYSRPDLKPYPAMVAKPENDVTRDTMEKDLYINKQGSSIKSSPFYRYFFARDADFTIKENPFDKYHKDDIWDHRKGHYATYGNNFGEHHQ